MDRKHIKETRINSEVQKEISRIIREEIKDPRLPQMTSVTSVSVTGDLKYAKIYVSMLADETHKAYGMEALKHATSFIRSLLAKNVNLRNTPELTFVLDDSIEYGVEMSKKIEALGMKHDED